MTNLQAQLNEYLFYEFGLEDDETAISDNFPFELRYLGSIDVDRNKTEVFEFVDDGEEFFAVAEHSLNFYPKAGMTFEDLHLQMRGAKWIVSHEPIDLNTSRIGIDSVPSTLERRAAIERLAANSFSSESSVNILEGLFLHGTKKYLALVQSQALRSATIISDEYEPCEVGFAAASSWRRLSIGVGKMLSLGKLAW